MFTVLNRKKISKICSDRNKNELLLTSMVFHLWTRGTWIHPLSIFLDSQLHFQFLLLSKGLASPVKSPLVSTKLRPATTSTPEDSKLSTGKYNKHLNYKLTKFSKTLFKGKSWCCLSFRKNTSWYESPGLSQGSDCTRETREYYNNSKSLRFS